MKAPYWKKRIKEATESAGTYRPYFDDVIKTLADILETRDDARKKYEDSGAEPVVEHTNKAGQTNLAEHPCLTLIIRLDQMALTYWKELGLTPAGLKKIDEETMKPQKVNKLYEMLKDIG